MERIDRVRYGDRDYEVKKAAIDVAASQTDAAVVAAVTGKKITLIGLILGAVAAGATTAQFTTKPAGAGTAIGPQINLAANANIFWPPETKGIIAQTVVSEGLSITTGGAAVDGLAFYIEV